MNRAAVSAIIFSTCAQLAFAQQSTDPIKQFSDLAINMTKERDAACVAPRVNTPDECVAEFEAVLALLAEITGWQVLLAKAMQDNDPERVAFFQAKHTRSVEFGLKVVGEIERRYILKSYTHPQPNSK